MLQCGWNSATLALGLYFFPLTLSFHSALFLPTETRQEYNRHMRLLRFPQGPSHTVLVIKGGLSFHGPPPLSFLPPSLPLPIMLNHCMRFCDGGSA